eukprot:g9734.t1
MAGILGGDADFARQFRMGQAEAGYGYLSPEQETLLAQRQAIVSSKAKISGKQFSFLVVRAASGSLHQVGEFDLVPQSIRLFPRSALVGMLTIEFLLPNQFERLFNVLTDQTEGQIDPLKWAKDDELYLGKDEIFSLFWETWREVLSPRNLPLLDPLPPPFAPMYQRQCNHVLSLDFESRFKNKIFVIKSQQRYASANNKKQNTQVMEMARRMETALKNIKGVSAGSVPNLQQLASNVAAVPEVRPGAGALVPLPGARGQNTNADGTPKIRVCKQWMTGACSSHNSAGCPHGMLHYGGSDQEKDRFERLSYISRALLKPGQKLTEAQLREKAKVGKC